MRDGERLFGYCGDNDVRNRRFIRFDRNGDLSTGTEPVDSHLSSILLILSFDKGSMRYQEKWHVFPLNVLVQISFAKVASSRCSTAFAVALDTKKALDP